MSNSHRRGTKTAPITINEDGPVVKREAEEEANSAVVAEVKKKMEKIERLAKGAITQAGIYLARVEYLEGLIDQKSDFIKTKQANDDDLKKQMDELKEELEDAKKHIAKLVSQTHEIKDEVIEGQGKTCTLESDLIKEKKKNEQLEKKIKESEKKNVKLEKENEELEKKVNDLTKEKEEERRMKDESEKEKEELRRKLKEMEKKGDLIKEKQKNDRLEKENEELRRMLMEMQKMREMDGSVPLNDAPVDEEETRAELREERGEEPMERMEMGDQMEDAFYDHNLDMTGLDGQDDDLIESGEEENTTGDLNIRQDLRDEGEVKNRRSSSRNASRSVKYADSMEESDQEDEPLTKKKRSESVEERDKMLRPSSKGGSQSNSVKKDKEESMGTVKKELECPECEYRAQSLAAWDSHLRRVHSTNPTLAGCLIRCECGHESYSSRHSYKCVGSNVTIIRTGDGKIRRFTDPVMTPQCVLCEMYPKTACGYALHLHKHHKSTLIANGIYLICSCGMRYNSHNGQMKHDKKCSGLEFTLQRLDED